MVVMMMVGDLFMFDWLKRKKKGWDSYIEQTTIWQKWEQSRTDEQWFDIGFQYGIWNEEPSERFSKYPAFLEGFDQARGK